MKKALLFIMLFFSNVVHAGPMANVEYIHLLVKQHWGIEIPYNPELENPKVAANMKYLLTVVDVANKMLNGAETSDYGNSEYATMAAADTIAAQDAISRLVSINPKFVVTTVPDTERFEFTIAAKGFFIVDWGDGKVTHNKTLDANAVKYSHTYDEPGTYDIGIIGQATGYNENTTIAAISFSQNTSTAKIQGSLGAVFPTIGNGNQGGQQPSFYYTFNGNSNLAGAIPGELFSGVRGAPVSRMFCYTFFGCPQLTVIPGELFAGLSGAPAVEVFHGTFHTTGISEIPGELFSGIRGKPAQGMFYDTFGKCVNLSGVLPSGLFSGISGAPASQMFSDTFHGNPGISGIPADFFGNISGPAANAMFKSMFASCPGLEGPSAQIGGVPLYKIWPSATAAQVGSCYSDATELSDYSEMPNNWK